MLNKVNSNRVEACLVPSRVIFFCQRFSFELCLPKSLATVKEELEVAHHDEGKLLY